MLRDHYPSGAALRQDLEEIYGPTLEELGATLEELVKAIAACEANGTGCGELYDAVMGAHPIESEVNWLPWLPILWCMTRWKGEILSFREAAKRAEEALRAAGLEVTSEAKHEWLEEYVQVRVERTTFVLM